MNYFIHNTAQELYCIEMLESGLGLVSGIGLCCLAGSMYDHYDRGEKKQMKERSFII